MIAKQKQRVKILIIEPDILAGEELAQDIQRWGYDSVLIDNHFKALTKLEDDDFDLVLVGMENTGIDGLEFCNLCCKRQQESRIGGVYLILIGEDWDRVAICESETLANDFLIKPYLKCELHWRIKSGVKFLRLQKELRKYLYIDPKTGLKNEEGLKTSLQAEVNRVGRKEGWLSVAILDFKDFEWLRIDKGIVWSRLVRETILRSIREMLRNYDQVGKLSNERIVLFSGDCDFGAMQALLKRINDLIQELRSKDLLLQKNDLSLEGIFLSVQVRTKDYKSFLCFEYLWSWIQENKNNAFDQLVGYLGVLSRDGLVLEQ
jgi:PleD family two-component response regulator